MSNTLIQIKRSTVTAVPPTLNIGEPAYSYSSDKLFLGNATGDGAIAIGGKYFVDQQNTILSIASAAFDQANTGGSAGAAFDKANAANMLAFYASSNAALAFGAANTAQYTANLSFDMANNAHADATAAFDKANTMLPAVGGTITGDLIVQGNATFSGLTTYANTQTILISDNILSLNSDLPAASAPSENAGIEVNRGSSTNTSLLWNEATDKWTFTNDGTNYSTIPTNTAVETAQSISVAAFDKANAANVLAFNTGVGANAWTNTSVDTIRTIANLAYDMANTANVNASNASYMLIGTVDPARISGSYTGITGLGDVTIGTWSANTISVDHGGTGAATFTGNGVIYGAGTAALKVTAAGTEGQVLQAAASGIPAFGMLDGGSF